MELKLTNQQQEMRSFVKGFAEKEAKPAVAGMEDDIFPAAVIKKMGEQGLLGIPIPAAYGGLEADFISYIIAIHEISKVSAALGVILSVHTSVGTNPILYFGTEKQKASYLPKLTKGKYLGAFALTEPGAGSDAAQLKLKAQRTAEDYVLNGSKIFITNGKEADTFITFARTGKEKGSKGISAFIVEKTTAGLSIGKNESKMGLHGTSTVMLHFDKCTVHQSQLLGGEGEGFRVAMANLNTGRIGIAAQALGIAEATSEFITGVIRGKSKPDQAVLLKMADISTKVEAARLLVYKAASLIDQGVPCVREVSTAKLYTTKIAREITIEAIDLMGMEGAVKPCPLERYFRDAKVTEIYEGTSEIQRVVIAKQLLK